MSGAMIFQGWVIVILTHLYRQRTAIIETAAR